MMGNDGGKGDEKPAHQVRLEGFRISPSPITNRQYFVFLEETGYARPKDPAFAKNYLLGYPDMPVVNVSYDDAVAFCKWASKKFNASCGFRQRRNGNIRIRVGRAEVFWNGSPTFTRRTTTRFHPSRTPRGRLPARNASSAEAGATPNDHETVVRRRANRDPRTLAISSVSASSSILRLSTNAISQHPRDSQKAD